MITVDISNVWGRISLSDLLALEQDVSAAHSMLLERSGPGSKWLAWMDLPSQGSSEMPDAVESAARQIRSDSDVCVVVGTGGACSGSQAAITLLQGANRNLHKRKGDPQIIFTGNNLSARHWNELMALLEGKDFSVIAISRSGTTLESAVAFRSLRWILERKYGSDEARKRIYAVTDPESGALVQMAREEGWTLLPFPQGISNGYSVLSAAGLLPMAVAGLDIRDILRGAAGAKEDYSLHSFENPEWLYAAVRNLLHRHGIAIELLESFEPGFRVFGQWWQQLSASSEGKNGNGLFPVPAELTAELSGLGQLIQQGPRNLFETVLRFEPPQQALTIGSDWKNTDGLNYLEGKTLPYVEEQAYLGAVAAHADGGIPVISVECGPLCEQTLGELFWFFQLTCNISAYILGVDPFDLPGLEAYEQNLFALLGRPEPDTL